MFCTEYESALHHGRNNHDATRVFQNLVRNHRVFGRIGEVIKHVLCFHETLFHLPRTLFTVHTLGLGVIFGLPCVVLRDRGTRLNINAVSPVTRNLSSFAYPSQGLLNELIKFACFESTIWLESP